MDPEKDIVIPFIRREGLDLTTLAVVEFSSRVPANRETILKVLKDAITAWVNTSERGRSVYASNSQDFNIGDLIEWWGADADLRDSLISHGIEDLCVLFSGDFSTGAREYDEVLVNRFDI